MPQMNPLLWLNLMIMTLIFFICFMIVNYFIFIPKKKDSKSSVFITEQKNWKW